MDFTFSNGDQFGNDSIYPYSPTNDIFISQPEITKYSKKKAHVPKRTEGFSRKGLTGCGSNYTSLSETSITEMHLIIILLVVLVIMCALIHYNVKKTCEDVKFLIAMMYSKQ